MKQNSAAVVAILLITACDDSSGDDFVGKTAHSIACQSDSFEGASLTHCIADPVKHRIANRLGPKGGPPYRGFAALAADRSTQESDPVFAMNGGMYGEDGNPIGYYVEEGSRLRKLNRAKGSGNFHLLPNGVFFGTGGKWAVLTAGEFAEKVEKRPEFGTQSGPMLVIHGKLHPKISEDGESRFIRNAVGVGADGRAHFVISEVPLSFGKLARYYRDELKVPDALFLDGNVSSLWDPSAGRQDAAVPIGPLIVVETIKRTD